MLDKSTDFYNRLHMGGFLGEEKLKKVKKNLSKLDRRPSFDITLLEARNPKQHAKYVDSLFEQMDGGYGRHRNENLVRRVPLNKLLRSGKVKI